MALKTILDNILSFLELLQAAKTSELHWNELSYKNAFKWAEYCNKIYLQSKGKPYEKQLDSEIRNLSSRLKLGCLVVELNLFENCVPLLTMALIFNEHVKFDKVILNVLNEYYDQDMLNELQVVDLKLKNVTKNISDVELATKSLIHLLLSFSSMHFVQCKSIRILMFERLSSLIESKDGFVIFCEFHSTLMKVCRCTNNHKFMNVMELTSDFMPIFYSKAHIWKEAFLRLCVKDEIILKEFVQYLINLGPTFQIFYNNKVQKNKTLFQWKNDNDQKITYTILLNWFNLFLHKSNNIKVLTLTSMLLSHAANTSDVNVFKTLCQELKLIHLLDL